MTKIVASAVLLAVASSGWMAMAGCEVDDSLPRRPRLAVPAGQEQNRENAEKRALEAPKPNLPTGQGSEFPGQSKAEPADADRPVILASDGFYGTDHSKGPLPHLPEKPVTTPSSGFTPVPGTGMTIEHSWGEVLPLQDYNHRPWGDTKTEYQTANVKANPTYYPSYVGVTKYNPVNGTTGGEVVNALIDVPWFYLNTVALPVLMVFQPPLQQVTQDRLGEDPNYFGFLPTSGAIVPAPTPGEYRFNYDFLKTDGAEPGTAGQTQPATQPKTMLEPEKK